MRNRLLIRFLAVIFFIAIFSGMLMYHGGSGYIPDAQHYAFTQDFLSDLGTTAGFNGAITSWASRILFGIALFAGSLSGTLFFLNMPGRTWFRTTLVGLFSLCIVALPFVPSDINSALHRALAVTGFVGLAIGCAITIRFLPREGWFVSCFRIYSLVLFFYIAWLFLGPRPEVAQEFLMAHVLLQKTTVFGFIILCALSTLPSAVIIKS